ncbi:AAA family ATPase [Deltaproteobacteria bacterium OttesenSCG-928-K17]|nr:AAA family ATPase [Deltaproteobacteria bacterium OttesenSCG-928-K17]
MMSRADIIQAADARLRQAGLFPTQIIADGQKHRCPVEGKPKGQDGEYRIYADDCPRVVWKNYRTGDYGTGKLYSTESGHSFDRAEYILSKTVAAVSNHPYLVRKGVAVPPGLKMKDGKLIVPAYAEGELRTIQFIDGEGNKRFLKDGQVQGASFALRGVGNTDAIYLTEGLATGISVWQALDGQSEVRICFSAANLVQVASSLRGRPIIVCADNDRFTPGNPGLTKALEAAKAVSGRVALATFGDDQPGTDFNDVHQADGLDEVRRQLAVFYEAETPGLRILTLGEFMDWPIPPREHLLYPVMPEQGLIQLYAPRGLGKTYVALGMGLAVASGRKLFNWDGRRPRRILYIDGEMPARAMQERLGKLVKALNLSDEALSNFSLLTPDIQSRSMPNLATPDGQEAIEPYLKDVDLLVIDNIATLCRAGRENDTESWLPVQGWLLDLRRRGLSVLIVHHAGKNGDQRGTSAKEDIMDTVINLRRPKDYQTEEGARFEVHLTKARDLSGSEARPFEAQLCDDGEALSWLVKDLEDREAEAVRELLEQDQSIREIAKELDLSKSNVHRLKQKIEAKDAA